MRILFDEKRESIDIFSFKVNQGGELELWVPDGVENEIKIFFADGIYQRIESEALERMPADRAYWHVMGCISEKISEIEAELEGKRKF